MYDPLNNVKLEKYLNELSDEYKQMLLNALLEKSNNIEELSISELLRIDSEIKKPLLNNYYKEQRKKRVFLLSGMLYMIIGFFTFILTQTYNIGYEELSLISIIIAFTGLIMSVFALGIGTFSSMNKYFKQKYQKDNIVKYEIVNKWRDLEGLAMDINVNKKLETPNSIISLFFENRFITVEEKKILKDFLGVRNDIVHSSTNNYDKKEMHDLLITINKIIDKLQKFV